MIQFFVFLTHSEKKARGRQQKNEAEVQAQKIFKLVADQYFTYYDPDFPITQLIQPKTDEESGGKGTVRSRPLNLEHVERTKKNMITLGPLKSNPLHAVLFKSDCTRSQLQLINTEDSQQVKRAIRNPSNDFKLQVIAGAHRIAALQELVRENAGSTDSIKDYQTWPVKVIVVPEQTKNTSAILNEYGVKENILSSEHLKLSKTDIVTNMRAAYKEVWPIRATSEEQDKNPVIEKHGWATSFKQEMLQRFAQQFANDERKWTIHSIDPYYQLSKCPDDLYSECMDLVSQLSEENQEAMVHNMNVLQGMSYSVRLKFVQDFKRDNEKPKTPAAFKSTIRRAKFIHNLQLTAINHVNEYYKENSLQLEKIKDLQDLRERYVNKFNASVFASCAEEQAAINAFLETITTSILDPTHKVIIIFTLYLIHITE